MLSICLVCLFSPSVDREGSMVGKLRFSSSFFFGKGFSPSVDRKHWCDAGHVFAIDGL